MAAEERCRCGCPVSDHAVVGFYVCRWSGGPDGGCGCDGYVQSQYEREDD